MSAPKKNSLNSKIRVARVFKMIYIQAKSQDVLNFLQGRGLSPPGNNLPEPAGGDKARL